MSRQEEVSKAIEAIAFEHESYGPDKETPESGLRVHIYNGDLDITQWDLTEPPDDEAYLADWEENPVIRVDTGTSIENLFHPEAPHRGAYSGDASPTLDEVLRMSPAEQQQAIVAAAISFLAYHGGSESWVSAVRE